MIPFGSPRLRNPLHCGARTQRGTVLMVTLIMLAALTLLATGAVENAVVELKIARNAEETDNAFQTAQSVVDFVLSDLSLLPSGETDENGVALNITNSLLYPTAADRLGVTAPDTLSVRATRVDCLQPERKASGSSLVTYSQTNFRIGVDLDRSASGRGRAGLRQGYAMLGPRCGS
ncbi:MAG: PilX N-terminal [Pseudomonadota bacterium]